VRNAIRLLGERGHDILITARDKEIVFDLLEHFKLLFVARKGVRKSLFGKALNMVEADSSILGASKRFRPDLLCGVNNPYVAHVGRLLGRPSLVFTDTEHAALQNFLMRPATEIHTPSCFEGDLGGNQVRYDGYHELAYLHPNYFTPDKSVLEDIGLAEEDRFFVLRFVSWDASHDVGQSGLDIEYIMEHVERLEKYGRVLITSENPIQKSLEGYRIPLHPHTIHDLLYYSSMYMGEGATMASEAAVLGTPSIYVNTLKLGYINELEKKYGMVYHIQNPKNAIEKAISLLQEGDIKNTWKKRQEKLLKDKIDVTKYIVEKIEQYQV